MEVKYPRGSERRKRDLHVHTPMSIIQNYGGDKPEVWENFISDLEKLPSDFKVIGINDYLFLDGYKKVLEYKAKGRLNNINLILPVLEFRSSELSGLEFKNIKRPNIHIIFADSSILDPNLIESQFLLTLNAKYQLEKEGKPFARILNRDSVIELGKQILSSVPGKERDKYFGPEIEGFNNLNLRFDQIRDSLQKDCFNGKYLLAIGKTEWDELKRGDGSIATKKNLINSCDIIFTSTESVEKFNNAKNKLKENAVKDLLLDCSDAHNFSNTKGKDGHLLKDRIGKCFTWIKADPSFEGLKQILYEPIERICIQEEKPQQKTGYEYIDHIDIDHKDINNKTILLHPNLTTIIGGRSSGKSLLMAIIAKKFNNTLAKKESKYNSYASELAQNTKVFWGTGTELPENHVDYFPQEAISELSRLDEYGELSEKLRGKIDDILDQKGLLAIKKQYQEFSFKNKLDIETNISELFKKRTFLRKIENDLTTYSAKNIIENEISKLQKHINKISTLTAKDKKSFDKLKEQLDSKQGEKEGLDNQKKILKNYYIDYEVLSESYFDINEEYASILAKKQIEINVYIKKTMKESINAIIVSIDNKKKTIENDIKKIKENTIYKKGMQNISDSQLLSDYEKKLSIEKGKLGKRQELENQIKGHKKDIDLLEKLLIEKNKNFLLKANEFVKDIQEEKKDKLSISPYIRVKNLELTNYLQEKINQQSKENKEISNFSGASSEIEARIFEIFEKLLADGGNELTLNGKDANRIESFCKGLLAENYLDIEFALTYDSVLFGEMSEGKRAFVILKLLLDFSEKIGPILIDQPEDDLDNRSISNELAEYLKEKKKIRQIIVVTHNANVVLGTDAESIIIANQHGEGTKNKENSKFEYIQGSIEHTFVLDGKIEEQLHKMGIREHICDILEGGEEAFKQRGRKYNLNNGSL